MNHDVDAYRGKWVAFDHVDDSIIAVADTEEQLEDALLAHSGRKVLMRRIPALDEPVFAGLG